MSEISTVWDGLLTGDATQAPYSAAEWAARQKLLQGQGSVFPNYGTLAGTGDGTYPALSVQAKSPASTQVEIEIGAALVFGYLYQNTAALSFTIGANASGNPRIDTAILRVDFVGQTVRAVVKQGTPAGSPVAPTMQQDTSYWEIPLGDIAVANGFATLAQSTITQRQRSLRSLAAGWQAIAYPPRFVFDVSSAGGDALLPAETRLIPFLLNGNMLLQQVDVWQATSQDYTFGWDLYVQDTNDGLVAEHTLRRVAQSNGNASGLAAGVAILRTLGISGGIVPLAPGAYWLAFQNRHAVNNFGLKFTSGGGTGFGSDAIDEFRKVTTNPNGQTLDAATGWTAGTQCGTEVRLRGRVFGQTTVP